jgi:transcriptional regulator with XRE-family HTH domain
MPVTVSVCRMPTDWCILAKPLAPEPRQKEGSVNHLPTMLRTRRDQLGISQERAAVALDTSRVTYDKWEKGKSIPDPRRAFALAEWLDLPLWKVLDALELLDEPIANLCREHLGGYLAPAA